MDLLQDFQNALSHKQLIEKGQKILIAVSGGVDSVVLLDLFHCVKEPYQLELRIVHLNHGLRGSESDEDEAFVKEKAAQYGLPIICKKVDTRSFALESKLSMEEAARVLRYQFFDATLEETGFQKLAIAHNADDQAETILDHLLRGSGIKGLSGMAFSRGKYIRPLLTTLRRDIEAYAREKNLKYRIDSSNWELKYRRNRIRYELIPYLRRQFNPKIIGVLLRTGELFSQTEAYLMQQAEMALDWILKSSKKDKIILDIKKFLSYLTIVQQYIIFTVLERLDIQRNVITSQGMERLLNLVAEGRSGAKFPIADGWEALIARDELVFRRAQVELFQEEVEVGKSYSLLGGQILFSSEEVKKKDIPENYGEGSRVEFIDFDKIVPPLILRNPRPGDRFRPLNLKGEKKLSDFFIDEKVPNYLRDQIPLLVCQKGIVWVCGYRIDDRYKVTPQTQRVLRLEIKEGYDAG